MPRRVCVSSGSSRYLQNISIGPHVFSADEPGDFGGNDEGPNPYELLLAALGTCTNITVRMYAERKLWPLLGVNVRLSCGTIHAEDSAASAAKVSMVDRIEMEISFTGDLSEDQFHRLFEIANRCPIHRTLVSHVEICSRLANVGGLAS